MINPLRLRGVCFMFFRKRFALHTSWCIEISQISNIKSRIVQWLTPMACIFYIRKGGIIHNCVGSFIAVLLYQAMREPQCMERRKSERFPRFSISNQLLLAAMEVGLYLNSYATHYSYFCSDAVGYIEPCCICTHSHLRSGRANSCRILWRADAC